MMLVVPLSSCITDNSVLSDNSGTLSGTAPTPPTSPLIPGNYTIEYYDGGTKLFSKTYDRTFAYAARLPDTHTIPSGKVFAGWSTSASQTPIDSATSGETSSQVDYLVYDDIKYDSTGIPIAADPSTNILKLYAVWTASPADGKLNTVYLSQNGSGDFSGSSEKNAVAFVKDNKIIGFNDAYAKLDPNGTTTTNRILICENIELKDLKDNDGKIISSIGTQTFLGPSGSQIEATISAKNNAKILFEINQDRGIGLRADTIFENISFGRTGTGNSSAFIYCNGYSLTIGENVNTDGLGSRGDNDKYGIPNKYMFITICAGGLGNSSYDSNSNTQPNMNSASRDPESPAIIKLLSGQFGRVSGSGRSYANLEPNSLANPLYSKIIVWGDDSKEQTDTTDAYHANIGTLAGGHIDSNTAGGAEIEVRSGKVINLIGGNVGNSARDNTFFGNIEVTVYDGTVGVIYGAGLGRLQNTTNPKLQVTLSGTVTINICGGTIGLDGTDKNLIETSGNVYGGGAASQTVFKTPKEYYTYSTESKITVNIFGGEILGNVYGGGYGYSEYIKPEIIKQGNKQVYMYDLLRSGYVYGDIFVNILENTTIGTYDNNGILQEGGNVYGGGKGYFSTGSKNTSTAQVTGNTNVNIFSGNLGSVYGGGEGIDGYQDIAKVTGSTSVYVLNGNISGNIYGGGSIAVVEGNTFITVAGGRIGGTADWGRVFGGGEGNLSYNWAGQIIGSTNVTISNGTILGSVYGGGNFGVVGTENIPSSTTINISGNPEIAGSVYGGGRGDERDNEPVPLDNNQIVNGVTKGNIYGDTNVTISGGKIGYDGSQGIDSEDSGSVFGGGKLGLVIGGTKVTVSGGEIYKNVFGGGKGLSKSVLIEYDVTNDKITSKLYNVLDTAYGPSMKNLDLNFSIVGSYRWEVSNDPDFATSTPILDNNNSTLSNAKSYLYKYEYVRLTLIIPNSTIGEEKVFSNIISESGTDLTYNEWALDNRYMVQFGIVSGSTNVNVSGGNIYNNVYGGGSYAAVGKITGENITPHEHDGFTYSFRHKIDSGSTNVTISGGTIGSDSSGTVSTGNVFGGGMGEPNLITTGSIGDHTTVTIKNGTILGNVYGGGENGFVGNAAVDISGNMTSLDIPGIDSSQLPQITYSYDLWMTSEDLPEQTIGSTSVIVKGGTIGNAGTEVGHIFGAGKGVSATVVNSSNVTINPTSAININGSVYGGGELGIVGLVTGRGTGATVTLTGGDTSVKISGTSSPQVNIEGDVFGAGKGKFTTSPTNAILGAAGKSAKVDISYSNVKIKGSVYGGGELGIVGSYSVDASNHLNFTDNGLATVTISAGTVYENVYGGGKGTALNKISGAVGKTDVKITGNAQIGYVEPVIDDNNKSLFVIKPDNGDISVTSSGSIETTHSDNIYSEYSVGYGDTVAFTYSSSKGAQAYSWKSTASSIINDGNNQATISGFKNNTTVYVTESEIISPYIINAQPVEGNVFVSVKIPEYGIIDVKNESGVDILPNGLYGDAKYTVYEIAKGTNIILTYSSGKVHNVTAYNTSLSSANISSGSDINTMALTVPNENITISVTGSNIYDVVIDDTLAHGKVSVEGTTPDGTPIANAVGSLYQVKYGSSLTFTYAPHDPKFYVKKWLTNPVYDISQVDNDSDKAVLNVQGDAYVSVLEGPAIGNVYGGGAYGVVGNVILNLDATDHPFIGSENDSSTNVTISGGTIGSGSSETVSTGNVFGGGYGPNAKVAGSAHVIIDNNAIDNNDKGSIIKIYGNVYGGGEMGSIGITAENSVDLVINKNITSDVKIIGSAKQITIGSKPSESIRDRFSDYFGNVFGGGQGGDIPSTVLKAEEDEYLKEKTVKAQSTSGTEEGYATVYGTTEVAVSGNNVTIYGNVYGGGEGLLKAPADGETIADAILDSVEYGRITGELKSSGTESAVAAKVTIDKGTNSHVHVSVFGGGKLGIIGSFDKSTGEFSGKDTVVIIFGNVYSNVYGGGEGHTNNAISGAVRNTLVIINDGAEIGLKDKIQPVPGPNNLTYSDGNVYGGGKLSVTGDSTVSTTDLGVLVKSTGNDNESHTNVIIAGGNIWNSVYGGGFSPIATIAGSTYVVIGNHLLQNTGSNSGDYEINKRLSAFYGSDYSHILNSIKVGNVVIGSNDIGNVYGGGEMGSVGTTVLEKTDPADASKFGLNLDENQTWVSANVIVKSDGNTVKINGNIYGGGKGILDSQINGMMGYALIRGHTVVNVDGGTNNSITVNGDIYGGGEGLRHDVESIHYAEVYDYTDVSIRNVVINGNVYGGGELGIIGHFVDNDPNDNDPISITIRSVTLNGIVEKGSTDGYYRITSLKYADTGESLADDETFNKRFSGITYDEMMKGLSNIPIINRDFCGDDIQGNPKTAGPKAYTGHGTTSVNVYDSKINGNVYGGGKGVVTNVLAGSVGRGTQVTIDGASNRVTGNVYGGGELGVIGSISTQVLGDGAFAPVKVVNVSHAKMDKQGNLIGGNDLDISNDVDIIVNIRGGQFDGSIFGAGKGEICNYEGAPGNPDTAISYYKLSVFGRTEVNVSGGIINKHVYGGSENGETGSLTVLKNIRKFTEDYWKRINVNPDGTTILPGDPGYRNGPPSDIPAEERDNHLNEKGDTAIPKFSASLVNIVGGTVYGNIFGGGYFGAVHGNTHVHIGWNSVMPYDDGSKGDCHYYNDYGDGNYGFRELPFADRDIFGDPNTTDMITPGSSTTHEHDVLLSKDSTVHDLFLNGTVYAGGDRGDPSATEINYDYISVYGTSHALINGTGYVTGTNVSVTEGNTTKHAMYIQGSLFGSGNSCSTFYTDIPNCRFITFVNYNANSELNKYIIYSIQRVTEVTLINSSIRLPGRSDGSNVNKTALYSLNHVHELILKNGSELILDTVVQDLRSITSIDGAGANTSPDNATNTIRLNNGITLIIKTEKNSEVNSTLLQILGAGNSAPTWPDGEFGKVTGYFFLDLSDASYYSTYVYGSQKSEGGFIYGNTFGSLSGTKIGYEDFGKIDETGSYRAWHPVGGGHLSASSTIVAKVESNNKTSLGYLNKGKIVLPMTEAGSKYTLIGYNIYPAQAASLEDNKASLRLIDENVSFGNSDVNRFFKLKAQLGAGFNDADLSGSAIWLVDGGKAQTEGKGFIATGGAVLPEIDLELYSNGVTQTTTAGYVVLLIQESIPIIDENGNTTGYTPGNEISAIVNIETQAEGFGAPVTGGYKNDMSLYATKEGEYSWNMSISNLDEEKYRFVLTDVSKNGNFNLVDTVGNSKSNYVIKMNHSLNNDNSTGWDGFSFEEFALKAGPHNKLLGETDGRFNTSFQFTINNLKDSSDYAKGTVTLTISYYKISTAAKASEEPVLSANTTPDGNIKIEIHVGELKPWYNVKFVPALGEDNAGVGAIATQQITHGNVAVKPTPDPSRQDNKYSFGGWYRTYGTDETGKEIYSDPYSFDVNDPSAVITADMTLYGKWVSSVTFNYNYDNCPSPSTVLLLDKEGTVGSSMPQNPVRAGYTFDGWSTSETGTADFTGDTKILQNTTVYAVWKQLNYTIQFDENVPTDATGAVDDIPNISNASDPVTLPTPSANELNSTDTSYKYEFVGWATSADALTGYTNSTAISNLIGENNVVVNGDQATITLYAVWKKSNLYTVTLTTDPATAGKYVKFEYCLNKTISDSSKWSDAKTAFNVTKEDTIHIRYSISAPGDAGYSFKEYLVDNVNQSSTNDILTLSNITKNTAVTLSLIAKQVEVKLDLGGGTLAAGVGNTITVTFGDTYSTLPADPPVKRGYIFKGWYTAKANGNIVTSSTEVTNPNNHTLYALWDPVTYYIVLHTDTGKTDLQSFSDYENTKSVTLVANTYTKNGFIFKGWSETDGGSTVNYADEASIPITDDMIDKAKSVTVSGTQIQNVVLELYSVWEPSNLTISFTKSGIPITSVIFDGDNWQNRIGIGPDAKIIINATTADGTFPLNSNDQIIWKENGTIVSSDRMKHKGEFELELICKRTIDGKEVTYQGKTFLEILPYTGTLDISFVNSSYVYSGHQPMIFDETNTTVFIDKDGNGSFNDGDYKLPWSDLQNPNNFTISYYDQNNTPLDGVPIDAGSYRLTLTAKPGASDFYKGDADKATSSDISGVFSITPYTGNIFIEVKENMIYDGSNAVQDPILNVYLGTDNSGFEIKDWKNLFNISFLDEHNNQMLDENGKPITTAPTDAGTYSVKLEAKSDSSNYYINETKKASGTSQYVIKKLPITITPESNQWKYYGDPVWSENNPTIHIGDSTFNEIQYTVSTTISGLQVSNFKPGKDSWTTYAALSGNLSVDNLSQYSPKADNYSFSLGDLIDSNNPNYTITLNTTMPDASNPGTTKTIYFKVKSLPVVIVPLDGQYRYYTDSNGKFTIYQDVNGTPSEIGASLGYKVFDFRDPLQSNNLKKQMGANKFVELSGKLSSDFLTGGNTAGSYNIEQGTINNDGGKNPNYEIHYLKHPSESPAPVLAAQSPTAEIKESPVTISLSGVNSKYDYTGSQLTNTGWTVKISDKDGNDITSSISIYYKYSTDSGKNWLDGLPTNAGSYEVRAVSDAVINKYLPGESNQASVKINKIAVTVTATNDYMSGGTKFIEKNYDGSVTIPDNSITENTHYTVSFSNGSSFSNIVKLKTAAYSNENVQRLNGNPSGEIQANNITATFELTDITNFEFSPGGDQITLSGKINPKSIVGDMIKSISINEKYHGQTVIGKNSIFAVVKDGTIELVVDRDYTIDVSNLNANDLSNVTANVTINGIGNYTSSASRSSGVELQTYKISVTVTDSNNKPLSGVSIILKSGEKPIGNVSTGANGTYTISNVPYGTPGTITAEKLGYEKGTVNILKTDYPVDANSGFTFSKNVKLSEITYNITYNLDGGSNDAGNPNTYTVDTETITLADASKKGYTFEGWYSEGTFTNKVTEITKGSTGDVTLYAKFTLETYNITYNLDGGSNDAGNPNTYTVDTETITLADASKKGYTFEGWYSEGTFTNKVTEITKGSTGDVTLYAKFTLETSEYTVTFDSNGGSKVNSVDVASGEKVTKPADPTRSGYEFKGWYKDNGTFLQEWNFDKDVVTADITLYAKWEPKDEPTPTIYKVEYNANGGEGEVPKAELHFAGEFVTVKSADLRKNGYTFKGWCDSVTQTIYQPDEKFRMPSRDVCLTAVWESDPISGKEVSVTFIVDNEIYGISSTHINTALNGAMQPDPIKEGFDFIGWYTKEGEVFTSKTLVNNDMTIYAKFELNEDYVLVTYIIDNEIYMTLACKKTKIIEPNISAGIGKELNGWYTDKELQNKFDFDTIINEDSLTLYAEWKNNSNFMILFIFALFAGFMAAVIASTKRISFYENKNDEEKYASVIIIGKGTLKDRLPSHSGSNFEGWYSESGELITEDTEITQSMKVYAHWKH